MLIELAQLNHNRNGELLANQLLDVAVRVASIRQFAVGQMVIRRLPSNLPSPLRRYSCAPVNP